MVLTFAPGRKRKFEPMGYHWISTALNRLAPPPPPNELSYRSQLGFIQNSSRRSVEWAQVKVCSFLGSGQRGANYSWFHQGQFFSSSIMRPPKASTSLLRPENGPLRPNVDCPRSKIYHFWPHIGPLRPHINPFKPQIGYLRHLISLFRPQCSPPRPLNGLKSTFSDLK